MVNRAKSRIPTLTGEWTDFNHHDPGITILQTFAWLTDMLHFYINSTGDVHLWKYLKLLGLSPVQPAAATALLELKPQAEGQRLLLPRGAQFAAGDIVFETAAPYDRAENRIVQIVSEADGAGRDITRFAGVDGGFSEIFAEGTDTALYLGFARPLEPEFAFYVEIDTSVPRNPFGEGFALARPAWAYFDGEGWRPAELILDETAGFLQGGFIRLRLDAASAPFSYGGTGVPCHTLRCTLLANDYDVLPRLGRVVVDCVPVVQTDTLCRTLRYRYDGSGAIVPDCGVTDGRLLTVAVREGDDYRVWYRYSAGEGDLCEVVPGDYAWQRVVRFDALRFGRAPEEGGEVVILVTSAAVLRRLSAETTSGYANARIDFDVEHLYGLELALAYERGGALRYDFWQRCDDLSAASPDDKVFTVDAEHKQLVFGDSIHGVQPERGCDIIPAALSVSLLDGGHVLAGEISRCLDAETASLTVANIGAASGGRRPLTPREMMPLLEEKLFATSRAVSAEDYVRIALSTPGLLLDKADVIADRDYARMYHVRRRPNTVYVVVMPKSAVPRPQLSRKYRELIAAHLERSRLLATRIEVIPPKYVGIEVSGTVALKDRSPDAREQVLDALSAYIDYRRSGTAFGRAIVYGELYARLRTLPCVRNVEGLSLERVGSGGRKNDGGDIEIFPDSLTWLKNTQIEFC